MKPFLTTAAVAALAVAAGVAMAKTPTPATASSPSFTGHQLAAAAKISLAQARAIALKARPGKITDQELEKEGGGSGLRFSFDVKSANLTYEVGVDAKTGEILENAAEGAHPD